MRNVNLPTHCGRGVKVSPFPLEGGSGFADGRHEVSSDSEEIELTRTEGSKAKLSERGANPRQVAGGRMRVI